jgi:hypothetical protein
MNPFRRRLERGFELAFVERSPNPRIVPGLKRNNGFSLGRTRGHHYHQYIRPYIAPHVMQITVGLIVL